MPRIVVMSLGLAAILALAVAGVGVAAPSRQGIEFQRGFKELTDQIPLIAGQPTEAEHYGPNGDGLQRTTTGLMVWRKADNVTAFTNGWWTWINGPFGLQGRPSDDRFEWELLASAPTAVPAPTPTVTPVPTATPAPLLPAPQLSAPTDGAELPREGTVGLTWLPVAGAVSYKIEFHDARYPNLIPGTSETTSYGVGHMDMRGPYSWRVAAMDGTGRQGPWSPTWSYLVEDSAADPFPRSAPQLLAPADGSEVAGADPNAGPGLGYAAGQGPFHAFTWVPGSEGYSWLIQVWLNDDVETLISRQIGEASAVFRVPKGGTLYWRVASTRGPWTGPFSPIRTVVGR